MNPIGLDSSMELQMWLGSLNRSVKHRTMVFFHPPKPTGWAPSDHVRWPRLNLDRFSQCAPEPYGLPKVLGASILKYLIYFDRIDCQSSIWGITSLGNFHIWTIVELRWSLSMFQKDCSHQSGFVSNETHQDDHFRGENHDSPTEWGTLCSDLYDHFSCMYMVYRTLYKGKISTFGERERDIYIYIHIDV